MKISVAGRDRTEELGARISGQADLMRRGPAPDFHPVDTSALSLKDRRDDQERLLALLRLIRINHAADTRPFKLPRKPGPFGGLMTLFRAFLWKLLRYQHDRMAFQQNTINTLVINAIETEADQRMAQVNGLAARLAKIESGLSEPEDKTQEQ